MKLSVALLLTVLSALLMYDMEARFIDSELHLKLVASVDGKSYFADKSLERNWTAAGKYCQSLGMNLATITTKEELTALKAAHSVPDFDNSFWTAGRDAQQTRQFSWNATGEGLSDLLLDFISQNTVVYQTCVLYSSIKNNGSGLRYWPCDRYAGIGTLCETEAS